MDAGRKDSSTFLAAAIWRVGLFLSVFFGLQQSWLAARGTLLERLVIDDLTVGGAAFLANLLTPGVGAVAAGSRLRAPGGGINILNGCEGVEIVFMLVAALAACPMAWRSRLAGIAAGMVFVFMLNQARILALFYAYRTDKALFGLLHGTVAPVFMIACTFVFVLLWTKVGAGGTAVHAAPRA